MQDNPQQLGAHIIGPRPLRRRNVRVRQESDYPHVSREHLQIAKKLSSMLLLGPPLCDELIALVQHTFNDEEARLVCLLGLSGRTAQDVAGEAAQAVDDVEPILRRMAMEKRTIAASGADGDRKYKLLPIFPGIFELALIGESMETMTPWHRRFAELFEALYETGFAADYTPRSTPLVRVLPVGKAIHSHPMALPSDRLDVVLDRYKVFGIGNCQCRMTASVMGRGCGKPLGNCASMGEGAARGIAEGWLKSVSKKELLAIKADAESHGLVTWIMNVESLKGQVCCSCCGCCCHAMRTISEFDVPGMMAPPHFMPELDKARCTHCGLCARGCPTAAIAVDPVGKGWSHRAERCIGCGLCAVACERQRAIKMEPVPGYKLPPNSWYALLARMAPGMLRTAWDVWRMRRRERR